MFLQTVYKRAGEVAAFVTDVKPLNGTSIKHNRINVPDDHLSETSGPGRVSGGRKILHKSQLVI